MPPFTSPTTLGEVVTADPSLARQLERRGLDSCCGGGRAIADTCAFPMVARLERQLVP